MVATKITRFEVFEGIKGKFGFRVLEHKCGECGGDLGSRFSMRCPNCGESFDSEMFDYVPERKK